MSRSPYNSLILTLAYIELRFHKGNANGAKSAYHNTGVKLLAQS